MAEQKNQVDEESSGEEKVPFDSRGKKKTSGASPLRRRSRHAALTGGKGSVCVPMIPGMTEQQVQGLREVFGLFDPEGSGRVRPDEIRTAASNAGLEKEYPEVWQLLAGLESHESVDFE
ncbi:unnamed protein product, partial [Durusdinium trenchii]